MQSGSLTTEGAGCTKGGLQLALLLRTEGSRSGSVAPASRDVGAFRAIGSTGLKVQIKRSG